VQPEPAQRVRGEARREALVADHDDLLVVSLHAVEARAALRIETPLEHVAVDDQRARDGAVTRALFDRPRVDEQRSVLLRVPRFARLQPAQAEPRFRQQ